MAQQQKQKSMTALLPAVALMIALASSLSALAANHDEFVNGELSGDPANPTVIAVDAGPNVISGLVTDNPLDRDIFTLVVPDDLEVTQIRLTFFELISTPSDGGMLFALEPGPQITDFNSPANLRGFAIVGVETGTQQGDDLLDDLGGGVLGTGEWTVWLQNTGSVTDYEITVEASAPVAPPPPAPTPGAVAVPGLGFTGMLALLLGVLLIAGLSLRPRSGE